MLNKVFALEREVGIRAPSLWQAFSFLITTRLHRRLCLKSSPSCSHACVLRLPPFHLGMQAFFAVAGTGHAGKLLFFDLQAFVYGGIDAACNG